MQSNQKKQLEEFVQSPELSGKSAELVQAFINLLSAIKGFGDACLMTLRNNRTYDALIGWMGTRNFLDMVMGYVLISTFEKRIGLLKAKRAVSILSESFGAFWRSVEVDEATPALLRGEVLYKRARPTFEPSATPVVVDEALTIHDDIRATGVSHKSYSVRFFKWDPVTTNFSYVGMGIRVSDDHLWVPMHVIDQLRDSQFKMKGSNRKVATLVYDESKVVKSSPVDEDDYMLYAIGKANFATTGTSKAKFKPLRLSNRVFVYGCAEGNESGTVSEGMCRSTPFNFLYQTTYSTVPGHSGAPVVQLVNSVEYVVGMHLAAKRSPEGTENLMLLGDVLRDYSGEEARLPEAFDTSSSSSAGTNASELDARDRVAAARYAQEYQAEAKRRGDHRFDDGVLEDSWKEADANEAVRFYRENKREFAETFAYVNKRGWVRAGGKQKGGTMTKYNESAQSLKNVSFAPATSSGLKGLERESAPLKQVCAVKSSESVKTLLKTQTSPASNLEEESACQSLLTLSQSAPQTQSPTQDQNETQDISALLNELLSTGKTTKSQVRKFISGWKHSDMK